MISVHDWPKGLVLLTRDGVGGMGFFASTPCQRGFECLLWTAAHVLYDRSDKLKSKVVTIQHKEKSLQIELDEPVMFSSPTMLDFVAFSVPTSVNSELGIRQLKFSPHICKVSQLVSMHGYVDGVLCRSSGQAQVSSTDAMEWVHYSSTIDTWSGTPMCAIDGSVVGIHRGRNTLLGNNYGTVIAPLLFRYKRGESEDMAKLYYVEDDLEDVQDGRYDASDVLAIEYMDKRDKEVKRLAVRSASTNGGPRRFIVTDRRVTPRDVLRQKIQSIDTADISNESKYEIKELIKTAKGRGASDEDVIEQLDSTVELYEKHTDRAKALLAREPDKFEDLEHAALWMRVLVGKVRNVDVYDELFETRLDNKELAAEARSLYVTESPILMQVKSLGRYKEIKRWGEEDERGVLLKPPAPQCKVSQQPSFGHVNQPVKVETNVPKLGGSLYQEVLVTTAPTVAAPSLPSTTLKRVVVKGSDERKHLSARPTHGKSVLVNTTKCGICNASHQTHNHRHAIARRRRKESGQKGNLMGTDPRTGRHQQSGRMGKPSLGGSNNSLGERKMIPILALYPVPQQVWNFILQAKQNSILRNPELHELPLQFRPLSQYYLSKRQVARLTKEYGYQPKWLRTLSDGAGRIVVQKLN